MLKMYWLHLLVPEFLSLLHISHKVSIIERSEVPLYTVVSQQYLSVSCLSDMHKGFYECSKLKNWMCELRMHLFAYNIFSSYYIRRSVHGKFYSF